MKTTKVTELETVVTSAAAINDNAAIPEQSAPIAPIAPIAQAHVMPYSLNPIRATMSEMTSITLTDYLNAFYADTEQAVINGQLSPVLKLILDKGFARHWTEHNSTFSKIPESAKLDSIREAFKFWSVGVLTKSAYDNLFKTPAAGSGKGGNTSYKALADKITQLSLSPDVEIDDRKHYAKITANLLKGGKMAYDKMLTLATPAAIIHAAEQAIIADKAAVVVELDLDFS